MPPSSPINRKLSSAPPSTTSAAEIPLSYPAAIRGCEPCKRRKRVCNGQKPCMPCVEGSQECVYSVVSDHPRSVFSTSTARRLSSGSACETCRRRKTKCDGCNPCGFCASSGIECINNNNTVERKKRQAAAAAAAAAQSNPGDNNEAMDRIEDRLRRIERLMTAFTPSPLSKNCTTSGYYRKLSSPLFSAQKPQRPHRHHSIQGISSTEPPKGIVVYTSLIFETCMIYSLNIDSFSAGNNLSSSPPPPPPLSPRTLRQSASQLTNQSMYLSPSSSSSTTSTTTPSPNMQSSTSTPTSNNESSWTQPTPIPSLMGKA